MHEKEIITLAKRKFANGLSYDMIASDLDLKSTVQYMVTNDYEREKKKAGAPKSINKRLSSQLVRTAKSRISRGEAVSAPVLIKDLQLDISPRTVQRELKQKGFTYTNVLKTLPLTAKHRKARV